MARNNAIRISVDAAPDLCGEWVAHPPSPPRLVREWSRAEAMVDSPTAWRRSPSVAPEQPAASVLSAQEENRDRNRRLLALLRAWHEEPPIPEEFWRDYEAELLAERKHNG